MVTVEHLSSSEYQALAEFRYQIRRFLRFSEKAAKAAGLEPGQHQLLLALNGLRQAGEPAIRDLAESLQLRHHSVVGLIDRLEEHGLVKRSRSETDRREVHIRLTEKGQEILRELSLHHRAELQTAGPALVRTLNALLKEENGREI